jgi:HEAT repeat protein
LIGLFDINSIQIRKTCSNELKGISRNLFVKDLLPALQDKDPVIRKNIVEILGNTDKSESRKYLKRAISDENEKVRVSAILSLGKIGDHNVITLLTPCLKQSSQIQSAAIKAIGSLGKEGEEVLFECLEKPDLMQKSALQLFDLGEREKVIEKLLSVLASGSFHW